MKKEDNYSKSKVREQEIKETTKKAIDDFTEKHNEYYLDRITDDDLLDYVSQPYWHNMRLSKRRMLQNNLTMKIEYKRRKEKITNNVFIGTKCKEKEDEKNSTVEIEENIATRRIFYKDGKTIFSHVANEISHTAFLKSAIQGENAVCPNCGNVAKISTYIDGCDYCNAKFTVHELDEKISAYSFREDYLNRLYSF